MLAVLAGFGTLSLLWALFGWLLPVCRAGWLVCPGCQECLCLVWTYLWLRGMGLIQCPLIVVDLGLEPRQRQRLLEEKIEICSPSELPDRLGIGAENT